MPNARSIEPRRLAGALVTALLLASCGSSDGAGTDAATTSMLESSSTTATVDDATESASSSTETTVVEEDVRTVLPSVEVVALATGESVDLRSVDPGGDRPLLLWFWAPH